MIPGTYAYGTEGGRCRVLVVDDDPASRFLQTEILSPSRFEVTEAVDGFSALELLRAKAFDVVLLDKKMPGIDGNEVCRRLRTELNLPLLPVIMVTGEATTEQLAVSFRAGANDFLGKPYSPMELVARVDAAVLRKRTMDLYDSPTVMLFTLARVLEARGITSAGQGRRLAAVARVLGEALGLEKEEVEVLQRAAIVHDIGLMSLPDRLLDGGDGFTDEEWAQYHSHPRLGAELCAGLNSLKLVSPVVLSQHERWDGSGYPNGLTGGVIPHLAQIFALVRRYEALTAGRGGEPALGHDAALGVIEEEAFGGRYDPGLATKLMTVARGQSERFLQAFRDDPPTEPLRQFARVSSLEDWRKAIFGVERVSENE